MRVTLLERMSGGVLLSHNLSVAVPSALRGLTSGFGMGTGYFPLAKAAVTLAVSPGISHGRTKTCSVIQLDMWTRGFVGFC